MPLALPLGELSPQATEREKAPFFNDKINLFALSVLAALGHLSHRERQEMPPIIQLKAQQIILLCLLTV